MQERKDARKEGFMKGGIHEVRDAGKKGFRRLVMQNLFMKLRKIGFCRHCCVHQSSASPYFLQFLNVCRMVDMLNLIV